MGGYGSTRWSGHLKKETVDNSRKLQIGLISSVIRKMEKAPARVTTEASWTYHDGTSAGNIRIVLKSSQSSEIQASLIYQVTQGERKSFYQYGVGLVSSRLYWGSRMWWWRCPDCGGQVGTLLLPPGGVRFLCRRCHGLTYRSCQESGAKRFWTQLITPEIMEHYPNMSVREVARVMECDLSNKRLSPTLQKKIRESSSIWYEMFVEKQRERILEQLKNIPNRYSIYLTPEDLCAQSGLTRVQFEALSNARLIVSDHEGRYRPKLAGWGRKLAYLLGEGWSVGEIKQWTKVRWKVGNPKEWKPKQ